MLNDFGSALIALLLGESAVSINRAAVSEARSDPSLADTLATVGREATLPDFVRYLESQDAHGSVTIDDPTRAAGDFLGLLLGDTQIRRLLGVLPAPKRREVKARATRATDMFLRLYGSDGQALSGN